MRQETPGTKIVKMNLTDLYLWGENPRYDRLGKKHTSDDMSCEDETQKLILSHIEKDVKGAKVYNSMLASGFQQKSTLICGFYHNGKLIVGDGNNRVASAKIISRDKKILKISDDIIQSFNDVEVMVFIGKSAKKNMRNFISDIHINGFREWSTTAIWTHIYKLYSSNDLEDKKESERLAVLQKKGKNMKVWFEALRMQEFAFKDNECRKLMEKSSKPDFLSFFYEISYKTDLKKIIKLNPDSLHIIGNMKELRDLIKLYVEKDKKKPHISSVKTLRCLASTYFLPGGKKTYDDFKKGIIEEKEMLRCYEEEVGEKNSKEIIQKMKNSINVAKNIPMRVVCENREELIKILKSGIRIFTKSIGYVSQFNSNQEFSKRVAK